MKVIVINYKNDYSYNLYNFIYSINKSIKIFKFNIYIYIIFLTSILNTVFMFIFSVVVHFPINYYSL